MNLPIPGNSPAAAGAWEEINAATRPPSAEAKAAAEKSEAYRKDLLLQASRDMLATFSTPEGQRALVWLRENTIEKPTMPSAIQIGADGIACAMMQNVREGENNLYRQIKKMMKEGESDVRIPA